MWSDVVWLVYEDFGFEVHTKTPWPDGMRRSLLRVVLGLELVWRYGWCDVAGLFGGD